MCVGVNVRLCVTVALSSAELDKHKFKHRMRVWFKKAPLAKSVLLHMIFIYIALGVCQL